VLSAAPEVVEAAEAVAVVTDTIMFHTLALTLLIITIIIFTAAAEAAAEVEAPQAAQVVVLEQMVLLLAETTTVQVDQEDMVEDMLQVEQEAMVAIGVAQVTQVLMHMARPVQQAVGLAAALVHMVLLVPMAQMVLTVL
jgi:hypothetical protein